MRLWIKKKELINSKLHLRNKLNKLETELYLNEENYGNEIDRLYNLKTNIYQKFNDSYDSLSISKKETVNFKEQDSNKVISIKPIKKTVVEVKQKKQIPTNISSNYGNIYATNIGKNGLKLDDVIDVIKIFIEKQKNKKID